MQTKTTKPRQPHKPPTMMARISSIVVGPMITNKLDRAKVARYRQALRQGDTFPPVTCIRHRRGCYEIFDGFHRYHARRLEGRKTIAIWFAVS